MGILYRELDNDKERSGLNNLCSWFTVMLRIRQIIILLLLILALTPAASAQGLRPHQAPPLLPLLPPGGLAAADVALSTIWPELLSAQIEYHALAGSYFQGLRTTGDIFAGCPTDQAMSWAGIIVLPPLPMTMWIDVYDGPHGQGFVVIMEVTDKGQTFRRSANAGPESWRKQPWQVVGEW